MNITNCLLCGKELVNVNFSMLVADKKCNNGCEFVYYQASGDNFKFKYNDKRYHIRTLGKIKEFSFIKINNNKIDIDVDFALELLMNKQFSRLETLVNFQ